MSDQLQEVGKARLSKSGKAVMLYFDEPSEMAMVSVKSMKELLNKSWSYIKIRKPVK
jgi:hypothetical protein